jgi:hypothetical protein
MIAGEGLSRTRRISKGRTNGVKNDIKRGMAFA